MNWQRTGGIDSMVWRGTSRTLRGYACPTRFVSADSTLPPYMGWVETRSDMKVYADTIDEVKLLLEALASLEE